MTETGKQEALMVRYLLGLSTEEERAEVEEQFFSNREYFDQLVALENSLIDDYVTDRMPVEQRIAFEKNIAPHQREDTAFSRALMEAITKKKVRLAATPKTKLVRHDQAAVLPIFAKRPFVIGVSLAALVFLCVAVALLFRSQSLSSRLSQSEAELTQLRGQSEEVERQLSQERFKKEQLAVDLKAEQDRRIEADSRAASAGSSYNPDRLSDVLLVALTNRFISRGGSGAAREIPVAEHHRWIRFQVSVKGYGSFESYRLTIKIPGGNTVFDSDPIKATASSKLAVNVPTERLNQGQYIAVLSGDRPGSDREGLQDYSFRLKYQ